MANKKAAKLHQLNGLCWCRRRDLNPHSQWPPPPQDGVSTNSTTSAKFFRSYYSSLVSSAVADSTSTDSVSEALAASSASIAGKSSDSIGKSPSTAGKSPSSIALSSMVGKSWLSVCSHFSPCFCHALAA